MSRGRTILHDFFFFNDTATTEIYTLSLHDALPISMVSGSFRKLAASFLISGEKVAENIRFWRFFGSRLMMRCRSGRKPMSSMRTASSITRSEEHTSELQSQSNLVCRLLLENKKHSHILREINATCHAGMSASKLNVCDLTPEQAAKRLEATRQRTRSALTEACLRTGACAGM